MFILVFTKVTKIVFNHVYIYMHRLIFDVPKIQSERRARASRLKRERKQRTNKKWKIFAKEKDQEIFGIATKKFQSLLQSAGMLLLMLYSLAKRSFSL